MLGTKRGTQTLNAGAGGVSSWRQVTISADTIGLIFTWTNTCLTLLILGQFNQSAIQAVKINNTGILSVLTLRPCQKPFLDLNIQVE